MLDLHQQDGWMGLVGFGRSQNVRCQEPLAGELDQAWAVGVLLCSSLGYQWDYQSWSGHRLRCPGTSFTEVFLAGHRLWGFQSNQYWGCLGRTAQSGVYQGSGGTVAAFPGWLKHLDCAPTCSIKVRVKCKKWHLLLSLILQRLPVVFTHWEDTVGLINGFLSHTSRCPLIAVLLLCPRVGKSSGGSQWSFSLLQDTVLGQGPCCYRVSVSPILINVVALSFVVQS